MRRKLIHHLQSIDGILLVDKPAHLSSNAVLKQAKTLFKARKAGHMGCLDPLATGMLPICFGEATKFAQLGLDADKCYVVSACFGQTTTTGDAQGDMLQTVDRLLSPDNIENQLPHFRGEILQVPPMYSALKYQGKKLYELARAGQEVPRQARAVTIHQFEMTDCNYPHAQFRVRCSKGTYIRTLIEDLGAALGVGAHVTQLRRLYTAGFETSPMYDLDTCAQFSHEALMHCLLPADILLAHLPIMILTAAHIEMLYRGQPLALERTAPVGYQRLYDETQGFQGLGEWDPSTGLLSAKRLRSIVPC